LRRQPSELTRSGRWDCDFSLRKVPNVPWIWLCSELTRSGRWDCDSGVRHLGHDLVFLGIDQIRTVGLRLCGHRSGRGDANEDHHSELTRSGRWDCDSVRSSEPGEKVCAGPSELTRSGRWDCDFFATWIMVPIRLTAVSELTRSGRWDCDSLVAPLDAHLILLSELTRLGRWDCDSASRSGCSRARAPRD
jgi:hypothetical protein